MPEGTIDFCSKLAANPKSTGKPNNNNMPKSIDKLATCKPATGHDAFLSGIFVYFNWNINKVVREQLLRYNFVNVISSQSLMHCFEKFKAEGLIDASISSVDDVPIGFKYWISFCCNYRQLKTIYAQRKNHKRPEWQEFCKDLELLPNMHWITGG
jgi:hypothetical protein